MGKYSFVLSDALCKQYFLFKEHKDYDKNIIMHLLKFHCGEFLINTKQLDRIGISREVSKNLHDSLRRSGFTTQTLEDLAGKTDYKLILCDDRSDYPYVNIEQDQISSTITGCFYRNISRDKAVMHIKALCKQAEKICLYDKYISDCLNVLSLFLPDKKVEIECGPKQLEASNMAYIQNMNAKWILKNELRMKMHHDRYIIIDDKVEVILSSGFKYLGEVSNELTYVVRPVLTNRLF